MSIFNEIYSNSFYLLTISDEKLHPFMQQNSATGLVSFRVGRTSSDNSLTHPDPLRCALELNEKEMFDYVINKGAFARFYIPKENGKVQPNYRSCKSRDIKKVVIHPDWKHLKK